MRGILMKVGINAQCGILKDFFITRLLDIASIFCCNVDIVNCRSLLFIGIKHWFITRELNGHCRHGDHAALKVVGMKNKNC